ncbi:CBS domain-containing protein [Actinomycetes bacterium NPDC127524]
MLIKNNYVTKEKVRVCPSSYTVGEALSFLRESGYRCVPVVNEENNHYEGQVYKVHLIEHLYENGGKDTDSVLDVATEKSSFIEEDSTLLKAVFNIDRLPFFAVVSSEERFKGIITHSVIMNLFRDGFGVKTGGLSLTIVVPELKGMMLILAETFKGYNIEGIHTFDNGDTLLRRVMITLSAEAERDLPKFQKKLEKHNFRIVDSEIIEKQ